jgi:acyl dehydratase
MGLNYGFGKVRFLQAVKVNTKVKGTVVLVCLLEKRQKYK